MSRTQRVQRERCVIYARARTSNTQITSRLIAAQIARTRRYAAARGLSVVQVFRDRNASAGDPHRRGLRTLVRRCDADATLGAVLVSGADRLARSLADWYELLAHCASRGIRVVDVRTHSPNASDARLVDRLT